MLPHPLRILNLEDRAEDMELEIYALKEAGYELEWERVDNEADFVNHLSPEPDVIIVDYSLPRWDGLKAIRKVRELKVDVPVIMVTGTLGDELAVTCVMQGAADYVLKDNLVRLPTAVRNAIQQRRLRQESAANIEKLSQLASALECIGDAVIIYGPQGDIQYVNTATQEIYGYTADELIGKDYGILFPPGDQERYLLGEQVFNRSLSEDWRGEVRKARKGGEGFDMSLLVSPVTDEAGNLLRLVSVGRDITEQKRAQQELQQRLQELAALNKSFHEQLTRSFTILEDYRDVLEQLEQRPQDAVAIARRELERLFPDSC